MSYPVFSSGDVLNASDMNAVGLWRVTGCTVTSVGGTAATASNGVITIGSGNTSVTVSSAFSADYDNYLIVSSGGSGSGANNLGFQLSGITGSVYRQLGYYQVWGAAAATNYSDGAGSTTWLIANTNGAYTWTMILTNPHDTVAKFATIDGYNTTTQYSFPSYCTSTTSATGFTISLTTGSLTGGKIRVYGYRD